MTAALPFLSDAELAALCEGLEQPHAPPALRLRPAVRFPVRRADPAQQRHLQPAPVRQVRHADRTRHPPLPDACRTRRAGAGFHGVLTR